MKTKHLGDCQASARVAATRRVHGGSERLVVGRRLLIISGHGEGASGRLTVSRTWELMMIQKGGGVYLKISRG